VNLRDAIELVLEVMREDAERELEALGEIGWLKILVSSIRVTGSSSGESVNVCPSSQI
jgi:hypothetical protein